MNQDPYDISNHYEFYPELGIYDITNDGKFNTELKKLNYAKSISTKNRLLDDISFEHYDTEKLWWIIMLYNNIVDPFNYPNTTIYLPALSDIEKCLLDNIENRKLLK